MTTTTTSPQRPKGMNLIARIGAALLVVAAGLGAATLAGSTEAKLAFGGTALPLTIAGLVLFLVGRRIGKVSFGTPAFVKQGRGLPAEGTIMAMWDTGVTVSGLAAGGRRVVLGFELQVQVAGRPSYRATVQQGTPRMLVGAVLPGAIVSLLVDPDDPARVHVDWSSAPRQGLFADQPPASDGAASPKVGSAAELLRTGVRGSGEVDSYQPLGTLRELGLTPPDSASIDDPVYAFSLQVRLPGEQPYRARFGNRIPKSVESTLRAGMLVDVAVSPENRQRVAIDWASVR